MLAYEREVCSACGNLVAVCSNPDIAWYPQRTTCYATAVRDLTMRRLTKRHEATAPGTGELHPLDGMSVWVSESDLTPDDDFV